MKRSGLRGRVALALVTMIGLAAVAVPAAADGRKIIAGRDADPGEYPAMVALLTGDVEDNFNAQFCGGSLVAPDWVLSAAHCVTDAENPNTDALIGAVDLSSGEGQRIAVDHIVVHPEYNDETIHNDIALFHLVEPVVDVELMSLSDEDGASLWAPGGIATLTGWGGLSTNQANQEYASHLQEVEMTIQDDPFCQEAMETYDGSIMVCAGDPGEEPEGGPDACQGDSGGPLVVPDPDGIGWLQFGIVSFGPTCGLTPSAYARVATFRAFVDANIGGGEEPEEPEPVFSDIEGDTHEDNIVLVAQAGIAGGYPDGTYRPGHPVTRGQMATFLDRALDLPVPQANHFSDIEGTTHADAINALYEAGIAGGFPDGTYRPDADVSRGQMATFLTRALDLPPAEADHFTDDNGTTHEASINSLFEAGVAGGFPDGTYRPDNVVTRGQMATFLARGFQLEPPPT